MKDFFRFYGLLFFFAIVASVYFLINDHINIRKIFKHRHKIQ